MEAGLSYHFPAGGMFLSTGQCPGPLHVLPAPSTHWAPCLLLPGAGVDHGFPNMPFWTYPPDLPPAPGGYIFGGQCTVEAGVPLGCQGWILGGQVVLPGPCPFPSTVRATTAAGADIHRRRPVVALFTGPPYRLLAAVGEAGGG